MKGHKCRCGFATVSQRSKCPRCGKRMKPLEWPDKGKVLSFTKLQAVPERFQNKYNLVLVGLRKGPKLVCWTSGTLNVGDEVSITEMNGKYFCNPKSELKFDLDEEQLKS